MSGFQQSSLSPSTLATLFTSKIADDCMYKFFKNMEKVDDVCSYSVCKIMFETWQTIMSNCTVCFSTCYVHGATSKVTTSLHVVNVWVQIALDFIWGKLNSGYWKDVSLVWREAYAIAAFFKAIILLTFGKEQEALNEIDKGILLGAPVFSDALKSFGSILTNEVLMDKLNYSDDSYGCEVQNNNQQRSIPCSIKEREKSGIGKVAFRNYSCCHKFHQISKGGSGTAASCINHQSITPIVDMFRRIAVINRPSLEEFYRRYMVTSTSVVISGAMDHWPAYATRKWRYKS